MVVVALMHGEQEREHENAVWLRDELLRACLGLENPSQLVYTTKTGRPCLDVEGADISASHSKGAVAVALSLPKGADPARKTFPKDVKIELIDLDAVRVGVDIEAVAGRDADRCIRLAARRFTPEEQTSVRLAADSREEFVSIWTQKESLCKLSGEGIRGLKSANTHSLPEGLELITRRIEINGDLYYLSLCCER